MWNESHCKSIAEKDFLSVEFDKMDINCWQFLALLSSLKLLVSVEWDLREFSRMILPNKNFIVKFSESGGNWREWPTIAVKKQN
jgi:hypothetical protein